MPFPVILWATFHPKWLLDFLRGFHCSSLPLFVVFYLDDSSLLWLFMPMTPRVLSSLMTPPFLTFRVNQCLCLMFADFDVAGLIVLHFWATSLPWHEFSQCPSPATIYSTSSTSEVAVSSRFNPLITLIADLLLHHPMQLAPLVLQCRFVIFDLAAAYCTDSTASLLPMIVSMNVFDLHLRDAVSLLLR
uniref:Serpentine receptor class gamma n=1 Tax=Panagrellus redivivus TaxID=6233 RepID=A0A7E4UN98_PANRE